MSDATLFPDHPSVSVVQACLQRKFPYFGKTIDKRIEDFGPAWLDDFESELAAFFVGAEAEEALINATIGYGRFALDGMKLQKLFDKQGAYIAKSYADVSQDVYHNQDYMFTLYLPGILLSQYVWFHHYSQVRLFRDRFIALCRARGVASFCDVGIGTGFYSKETLRQLPEARGAGYDISEHSLEHTRLMLTRWGFDQRYSWNQRNIIDDPPTERYDAALSIEVLEHLEDPVAYLRALRAMVRPGGVAFITAAVNAPNADHIYLYRNLEAVVAEVEEAGFHVLESCDIPGYVPKPGESVPSNSICIVEVKE